MHMGVKEKEKRQESTQNDLQAFGLSMWVNGDTIIWEGKDLRISMTGKSEQFCLVTFGLRLPSSFSSEYLLHSVIILFIYFFVLVHH